MKTLSSSLIALTLAGTAGPAAIAQLPDITGQVQGTIQNSTRLGVDNRLGDTLVDQRTGLAADTRLASHLNSRLGSYHMSDAQGSLRAQLDADARAWVRTPEARVRTRTSGHGHASMRGPRHDASYARVNVYTRDGYHVGYVDPEPFASDGQLRVRSRTKAGTQIGYVAADRARFSQDANAVVLAMGKAEFGNRPFHGS
ncbi:hypothetical protein [Maricaulis sp. CAU 1757]